MANDVTAEEVLQEVFTLTDACIEQGGMFRYDECVQRVFLMCFDYFHPEHRDRAQEQK